MPLFFLVKFCCIRSLGESALALGGLTVFATMFVKVSFLFAALVLAQE